MLDHRKLITIIIATVLSLFIFSVVSGCRTAEYHKAKFIQKGGIIDTVDRIVNYRDTIKGADGEDSIIYRSVTIPCPEMEAPKTIKEYRYLRNTKKDSLDHELKALRERNDFLVDSLKNDKKIHQIDAKKEIKKDRIESRPIFQWFHWLLIIICFLLGLYINNILKRLFLNRV